MASMGMMGALGGFGNALVHESGVMLKREDEELADAKNRSLQEWLMQTREEYAVKAEGRAETRAIASEGRATQREIEKDNRTFENEVSRAPTKREIKVADENASAAGKLSFETENIGTITANKKANANASQSDADVGLKEAQADFYKVREAAATDKPGKMSEADAAVFKGKIDEAKRLDEKHETMRLEGSWTGSPEQKKSEAKVIALRREAREIANRYSKGDAPPAADPMGLRKQPGMMGPTNAAERGMKAEVNEPMGADPASVDREIAAVNADLRKVSDPSSRADLEAHLKDLTRIKTGLGDKPAPAAAAPAVEAAPVAEFSEDPAQTAKMDSELAEMGAGKRMKFSPEVKPYADKVQALRRKLADKRDREAAMQRSRSNVRSSGISTSTGLL